MKTGILTLAKRVIPVRQSSHQFGWLSTWINVTGAEIIRNDYTIEDLRKFQRIIIYNDMNAKSGYLDYPGGCQPSMQETIKIRIDILEQAREEGILIRQTDFNQKFYTAFNKRSDTAHINIPEWMDEIVHIHQSEFNNKCRVIGDSHGISITPSGWSCDRRDGQTLRGALSKGISSFLIGSETHVAISLGDIDLRFHFGGDESPFNSIESKLYELHKQVSEIQRNGVKVWIKEAMPQMPDNRRMPKSGKLKLKGSKELVSYVGSLRDRVEWTNAFNKGLAERFENIIKFDDYIGEDLLLKMERSERGVKGASVHLAPPFYNNKWIS